MKQTRFRFANESTEFGGVHAKRPGRKSLRPLCIRRPIHLVLKANRNIFEVHEEVHQVLFAIAHRFEVILYDLAVAHDHLHVVLRIPSRDAYRKFIRALTGLIARKLGRKLWALLPFTRLAHWGRDFRNLESYLRQNREETLGHRPYKTRARKNRSQHRNTG